MVFFIIFLALLTFNSNLNAYIDPGSGSLILQMMIAGFAASLYFIKVFWSNIKAFTKSIFKR
ncbi:hypothetical protein KAW80_00320 [Candidatus Babeliales bacterium]|nr:hypothetical protein [Candidatus Babeliales bacterium]